MDATINLTAPSELFLVDNPKEHSKTEHLEKSELFLVEGGPKEHFVVETEEGGNPKEHSKTEHYAFGDYWRLF